MIQEALYSFICHRYAMDDPLVSKEFPLDPDSTKANLDTIIRSIKTGLHFIVKDPEKIANHNNIDINTRQIKYTGYPNYPFETACIWFTPHVYYISDPHATTKENHLICINRINPRVAHFIYAVSNTENKKIDRFKGEVDFSWEIVPHSLLFVLPPYGIDDTPVLPLPESLCENKRLREKIVAIKTGEAEDSNMSFISMERDNKEELFSDSNQTLLPGIFFFFLGFMEKYRNGSLKREMGEEDKLVIDPEEAPPGKPHIEKEPIIFPNITYQTISLSPSAKGLIKKKKKGNKKKMKRESRKKNRKK